MDKIRPFLKNPDFQPAKIAQASKAAEGFCKWVIAMEVYDRVIKAVKPKQESLAEAQKNTRIAMEQLAKKKQELKEIEDLLEQLNADFERVNQHKKKLEAEAIECSERLERAEKLINGLSQEREVEFRLFLLLCSFLPRSLLTCSAGRIRLRSSEQTGRILSEMCWYVWKTLQ